MGLAILWAISKKNRPKKLIGINFGRQKGVVSRNYLVLHGVQTSDLGKAHNNINKEKLSRLVFQAWKLRLQEISADSEETSKFILS